MRTVSMGLGNGGLVGPTLSGGGAGAPFLGSVGSVSFGNRCTGWLVSI